MPIFYVQYQVEPAAGSEHFESAGGAFVNCWVKDRGAANKPSQVTRETRAPEGRR
jgi:hypothetical protein